MSKLKRPLLKNNYLSLSGNEPFLKNFSLYSSFPIGLMIITKMDPTSCCRDKNEKDKNKDDEIEIKIKFINEQASELFDIKENDSIEKVHQQLKQFKKFEKNQVVEETLDYFLFYDEDKDFYGSFKNQASLIYVKYKIKKNDLYICADYYNDERKMIQNQLFKGLKFQYMATLFHELYNPINALLFTIDTKQNEEKEEIIRSNLGNPNFISEIEESRLSLTSDNFDVKLNLNLQDNENISIRKARKINEVYKEKLIAMLEKEKDISVLVNMIYIFLENLILYLRLNLGVVNNELKEENNSSNQSENSLNENDLNNKESNNKIGNDFNNYLIKQNKKLNLAFSFKKHLKKFSYLFKFKGIHYTNDFSYLSNKYITTDESIFFDFLGQLYTLLYYIVPKYQGFEISYSVINENKLKILFLKTNCPKRVGSRLKKLKRNSIFILCQDKFKATSTVKTSEMTQEILYKLAEILGIKLKIMEYDDQKEDKYLTILMPFFIGEENDLVDSEIEDVQINNSGKVPYLSETTKANLLNNNNNQNINEENAKPIIKIQNINININKNNINHNYLNPNFYKFNPENKASFLIEQVEEKNSSEENFSCKEEINKKESFNKKSINNNNKNNISYSVISKSSMNNPGISLLTCSQKMMDIKSKSPMSDKNCLQLNNFKDLSNNYLNDINHSIIQNDNFTSKDIYKDNNINVLTLIHEKYTNIGRLKRGGVEILKETDNIIEKDNNNKLFEIESLNSIDNNTSFKEKRSIDVELDSDDFVEFENEEVDDFNNNNQKNEMNSLNQINKMKKNNTVLLNLNYIYNNSLNNNSPKNRASQKLLKNKRLFDANKRSNKTLILNKPTDDSLFVIPEMHENPLGKYPKLAKTQIKCDCKDILLVDDDEFILKTSKNILKHFKLEADCAENGQECLNKIKEKQEKKCDCQKNKYKIIPTDITMPIMDGIEAAKNIQKLIDDNKLYDTIKIIFISAHVNLDLSKILTGIKCAVDYYAKPISKDKYKSLLDKYYYSK